MAQQGDEEIQSELEWQILKWNTAEKQFDVKYDSTMGQFINDSRFKLSLQAVIARTMERYKTNLLNGHPDIKLSEEFYSGAVNHILDQVHFKAREAYIPLVLGKEKKDKSTAFDQVTKNTATMVKDVRLRRIMETSSPPYIILKEYIALELPGSQETQPSK